MFDVGFTELLVIGVVALIVIGPERLPQVARTAGALLGRLQRYVSEVKADVSRELRMEELRRMQEEVEKSAREVELSIGKEVNTLETSLNESVGLATETAQAANAESAAASAAPQSGEQATDSPPAPPSPAADGQMELELKPAAAERRSA